MAIRVQCACGSSLQAEVEIRASGERLALLQSLGDDLRFVLITSQAKVVPTEGEGSIEATPSAHSKCERCWKYVPSVGAHGHLPTVCTPRAEAVAEITAA